MSGMTITGGEQIEVEPLGSPAPGMAGAGNAVIDLLPVLRSIGGAPWHVPLSATGSPFARIRIAGGANFAYNTMFDTLVYLG